MQDSQSQSREEILEEYKATLQDTAAMNGRRQNTNGLFVSINVVFLTGLGFLLFSSHFTSWWTAIELVAISIAILPLNGAWLWTISVYRQLIRMRHERLRVLEGALNMVGRVYEHYKKIGLPPTPIIRVETSIASYFLGFYIALDAVAVLLTYLVTHGLLTLPK